jgi:flagellar basal-body rod modification protein FlgD
MGAGGLTGTTSTDTAAGGTQQTLTQNDFLQLLVAQMQNQDPTNPQSDTEMASQMAQFTSLTQSSAMSASLAMIQANSLVGSTVTVSTDSTGDTTSGFNSAPVRPAANRKS